MRQGRKRRKIVICVLCLVLLLMAVGYAIFSSKLDIKGTSKITSVWDVEITNIETTNINGTASNKVNPTYTKDTATFSALLKSPGDYIYYKVEVTNKGTLPAIAKLGNLSCSDNDAIECGAYADSSVSTNINSNTNLENSRLIIDAGEKEYYNVWVKYSDNVTNQPSNTNSNITLTLTYEQSDVGITYYSPDNCYTGKVLKDGTMEITDYDASCGTDVVIPETINGYTVTRIADGRWDNTSSRYVSAFAYKNIESVIFPDTINYIGNNSFVNNRITSLTFSNSLTTIGVEAFVGNKITTLTLPSGLKSIGDAAFRNNKLTSIDIPSSVTYLGGGAFVKNNVVGEEAFIYGRNSDGSIDYTTLNSYAGQTATGTTIPSVTTIAGAAYRTVEYREVVIPETVKTIGNLAFQDSRINKLILNSQVESIGVQAFRNNNLTGDLTVPNSVVTIGSNAFTGNHLQTVTIGSGIKTIGQNAFQTTSNYNPIKSITINRKEGAVTGSPWGASNATINWTGTN